MKRTRTNLFLSLALTVVISFSMSLAHAQDAGEPVVLEIPAGAEAGSDFDVDKATEAYINLLSADQRARSDAYHFR